MGTELFARVTKRRMTYDLPLMSGPAYHVLLAMAIVARDRDPEPVYFGGWAWLACCALNRDPSYDRADEQAVGRAIRELVSLGLIKPRGRRSGMQSEAVYELTV